MKRFTAVLLALLMLVGVLSGCASKGGAEPATSSAANVKSTDQLNSSAPAASAEVTASATKGTEQPSSSPSAERTKAAADSSSVNLKDMYTVKDPQGVEYDKRIVLYKPLLKSDEHYADGCRYVFTVLYGKEKKGVYMYSVEIYETKEQAEAYLATQKNKGAVDGVAYIVTSDAAFFAKMESFVPDLDTWVSNLQQSGLTELD